MRVTRAQAAENHQRVIDVASGLFKEHGFDGIGLTDVMKAAGLTHGGFYKQFASKDDLVASACKRAVEKARERWVAAASAGGEAPLQALVKFYLSEQHRDEIAEGCPLVALASDASRHSDAVREEFEAGIKGVLEILDQSVAPAEGEPTRDKSLATLSMMAGALLLSRVVNDEALSRRFLTAAASELVASAP
ncbi:TetR family transcriptional regulator [Rhodoblastus sphagnicola]|uniref:TetR family transcriptional regulator n=1 Tax=Rhodoblastus sphagnicola TaxID=333368 RepID=A0A2S6N0Q6_9HYPH|nr:TetR/AcrR family transcriptional regulator [Rhodoblastus sphagnicola]MBB4200469.1 TetR/AcrR family transcriptional repressor of nem operon [Rhodoblastus sphagnicola]PPQ28178.1 TetR family transcriptional regulator [Rhodoblastus sphagnicola]